MYKQTKKKIKSSREYRIQRAASKIISYIVLFLVSSLSLYPLLQMIINSFKTNNEMYRNPSGLPIVWTWASYGQIFEFHSGLWRNFINSVIISLLSTTFAVLLCALAAFAFAKYRFRGRDIIFSLLLMTIMVPGEITLPGQFILFAKLHWINSLRVQILPGVSSVFGLFLIRQYMLDVPTELIEAARMDGAGHWSVFWRIMIPVCTPVLGAFAILHFMGMWNAYTWPMLVATKTTIQPISIVLPSLVDPYIGFLPAWGTIMAGCVLSTLPLFILFLAFQDYFMSSVVVGAIKG